MEIQIDSAADQAILTALRAGRQRQAAGMLVRYYGSTIFSLCRTLVPEAELAEDLTQEAFKRAFGALSSIQGQASPRVWLMNIAQQCCADHAQERARAVGEEIPALDPGQAAEAGSFRISESLQRRLEVLAQAL